MLGFTSRKQVAFTVVTLSASLLLVLAGGCASKSKPAAANRVVSFWPEAPDEPRVQFLVSYNSSADIQAKQSQFDEMLYGKQSIMPLGKPYGVAMANGKIYVCDVRSQGVTVLDLPKRQTRVVGLGEGNGIGKPVDIAIAPDGRKYVVDATHRRIGVLDASDQLETGFSLKDFNPVSVAVWQNELFVADFKGQTIKVLDRTSGQLLRTIGEGGPDDGQFVRPLTVRVDPEGNVVVADVLKCRVQKFSRDGQLLSAFGQAGNRAGDLVRPKHFAFDKNGYLYIADAAFSNVQAFDREGKVAGFFGAVGTHPGAMDLPAGLYVDEDPADLALFKEYVHPAFNAERLILVTNQFGNHRVAIYALGRLKPGKTLADITATRSKMSSGTTTQPIADLSQQPEQEEQPQSVMRNNARPDADGGQAAPATAPASRPAATP